MNQPSAYLCKTLRLLTLAAACAIPSAYADAFSDASQLLRANKLSEALAAADAYLANKPADAQMRFLKGVILRGQGKSDAAIAVFLQLTQDYPELAEPYNNLAVAYASEGQFDLARAALENAVRNNPGYATAHENLGDIYAKLASEAYARALEIDAGNAAIKPKLAALQALLQPAEAASAPAR